MYIDVQLSCAFYENKPFFGKDFAVSQSFHAEKWSEIADFYLDFLCHFKAVSTW